MLDSLDYLGPVVNEREITFVTRGDPLGYRPDYRYEFEHTVFDAFSISCQARIVYRDWVLREGFSLGENMEPLGASLEPAITEAKGYLQKLEGAPPELTVEVIADLTERLKFVDDLRPPRFDGAVMVITVPDWWAIAGVTGPHRHVTRFTIWRNGEMTEDGRKLEEKIQSLKGEDVAGDRRKGALR